MQFALVLLHFEAVDALDFGLDVGVYDRAFGHRDQQVLDVHLLQLRRGGGGLEVRLEDRDVAQLSPAFDLVLLLYFY